MANITSSVDRSASTTRVDPRVASPMTPLSAAGQLQAIIDAARPARGPVFRAPAPAPARPRPFGSRARSSVPRPPVVRARNLADEARRRGEAAGAEEVARMAALDRYEMSRRNSAKRPVTGPNMIGGMIEDPTRLPSRYRAQTSGFGSSGSSMASAGDDVRAGQAADQQLEQGRLGLDRQQLLLRALEDRRFADVGIG